MSMQQYLDTLCVSLNLHWIVVTNDDGLTLCASGMDEQLELAALLPDWTSVSHQIAKAAHLEQGMGLLCLVPKVGGYLLLVRDFATGDSTKYLVMATKKIPNKSANTLEDICIKLNTYF